MDNQQGNANQQEATNPSNSGGFRGMIFEQYRKAKDNVEAYPYVWASYLLVYGGFGLWVSYRYNKLSRTENRVRVLQEKLRNLRQEREPRTSTAAIANISSSIDKPTK
ncbi:hypothetical protein L1887_12223 [Cichorium endivia]|nr:hypothetical protein L1887_12223 [Cichorium endivia]